jgi:hypothetical protein
VVRPDFVILDWVRLALPRCPESGVEVSTPGKILSREKRKMWKSFFQMAHILWCVFHSAPFSSCKFFLILLRTLLVSCLRETF